MDKKTLVLAMEPLVEDVAWSDGGDFKLSKLKHGNFASFRSSFTMKERPLSATELAALHSSFTQEF